MCQVTAGARAVALGWDPKNAHSFRVRSVGRRGRVPGESLHTFFFALLPLPPQLLSQPSGPRWRILVLLPSLDTLGGSVKWNCFFYVE